MSDWRRLTQELDAWAGAGRVADVWWRDDDAVAPSPALERVLGLAAAHGVPVAIAVIPAGADRALADRLAAERPRATPLQHGYAHTNHAPASEKKCELGTHRPAPEALGDLRRGRDRMTALFGADWAATLVPPWNRIAAHVVSALPRLGFRGLSTYGPRGGAEAMPGLVQVNCHVDIMRWMAPRGFAGEDAALGLLLGHLEARRAGTADASEPTGLLTHHRAHDEACWAFLDRLLGYLAAHPGARFVAAGEAFAAPGTRGAA